MILPTGKDNALVVLLYVTRSRAEKSLAIVVYPQPLLAKQNAIDAGWLKESEIETLVIRTGDFSTSSYRYKIDEDTDQEWLPTFATDGESMYLGSPEAPPPLEQMLRGGKAPTVIFASLMYLQCPSKAHC